MAQKSMADIMRERSQKKAKEDLANKGDPREFLPGFGTFRVRLLPPRDFKSPDPRSISFDDLFYHTHSYHFMHESWDDLAKNTGKGQYVYTCKEYSVPDGRGNFVRKNDPIDDLARSWFAQAARTKDEALKKLAGAIKRKRRFVCPVILLDETDPTKKFRILVDNSNDGKLMKMLCLLQGLPFYRDVEDGWVDKASTELKNGKRYFDLLDPVAGYDFTIVKEKDGQNNWDISYAQSFVEEVNGPRALTEEELKLMEQRFDIKTYITYENDYQRVYNMLLDLVGADALEEQPASSNSAPAPAQNAPASPAPAASAPAASMTPPPAAKAPSMPEPQIQRQATASGVTEEDAEGVNSILAALEDEQKA